MALLPARDSAVLPCFHGCLAFFYQHFLTSPQSISPQSTRALALGFYSTMPKLQLPELQLVRGTSIPVLYMYGCGKGCLILTPFRLPQISYFILSFKCFSCDSDNCPTVGIRPLLQFPHPLRAGPIPLTLLFSPLVPSSYRNLCSIKSFPLVRYSCLFSCTSVSKGVFLMCPWREMYSMSTCSSAILFSWGKLDAGSTKALMDLALSPGLSH